MRVGAEVKITILRPIRCQNSQQGKKGKRRPIMWMVKNFKDGRVVMKHKEFDRYYVSGPIMITDDRILETEFYITEDLKEAHEVLEATKHHWAGINVDGWKVVEADSISELS